MCSAHWKKEPGSESRSRGIRFICITYTTHSHVDRHVGSLSYLSLSVLCVIAIAIIHTRLV